jgi:hypothetical protein
MLKFRGKLKTFSEEALKKALGEAWEVKEGEKNEWGGLFVKKRCTDGAVPKELFFPYDPENRGCDKKVYLGIDPPYESPDENEELVRELARIGFLELEEEPWWPNNPFRGGQNC